MELKDYQGKVIERVGRYLGTLRDKREEAEEYAEFQRSRGRDAEPRNGDYPIDVPARGCDMRNDRPATEREAIDCDHDVECAGQISADGPSKQDVAPRFKEAIGKNVGLGIGEILKRPRNVLSDGHKGAILE